MISDDTPVVESQSEFKGDLSSLNTNTEQLENFRNENGVQLNEYLIEHGIKGLDIAFKGGMLPLGITGLKVNLPGKIAELAGVAGLPTTTGLVQKKAGKKILTNSTPIIVDVSSTKNSQKPLNYRRNPKEGFVKKGHQLLYDIVFGWWLDN